MQANIKKVLAVGGVCIAKANGSVASPKSKYHELLKTAIQDLGGVSYHSAKN